MPHCKVKNEKVRTLYIVAVPYGIHFWSCCMCHPDGGRSTQELKYLTMLWWSSLANAFTSRITLSLDFSL